MEADGATFLAVGILHNNGSLICYWLLFQGAWENQLIQVSEIHRFGQFFSNENVHGLDSHKRPIGDSKMKPQM